MHKISVLIVDDNEDVQINVSKLLDFHPQIKAVGVASTAQEAITKVKRLKPDIVLMDINMPGMDGITATGIISTEEPSTNVIMMSVQGETEYMRSSMMVGARNYLTKPFSGDELYQAIIQVYDLEKKRASQTGAEQKPLAEGKIVTVFSTKGGVGKTTIATNLAVALPLKTGASVAIIDLDLQFGDVALFLNIMPLVTIAELAKNASYLDARMLREHMHKCGENLQVLSAPRHPQEAEAITGSQVIKILNVLRQNFDYVIVDTVPSFEETVLEVLDLSDTILMVSGSDMPTIKRVKLGIEILESLGYGEDKIKLVLNRADSQSGVGKEVVEKLLSSTFSATLPSDGKTVIASVNRGIPFVISNPETNVSQGIFQLVKLVAGEDLDKPNKPIKLADGIVSKFKRLFR